MNESENNMISIIKSKYNSWKLVFWLMIGHLVEIAIFIVLDIQLNMEFKLLITFVVFSTGMTMFAALHYMSKYKKLINKFE